MSSKPSSRKSRSSRSSRIRYKTSNRYSRSSRNSRSSSVYKSVKLQDLTMTQLQARAASLGIPFQGLNKAKLIRAIKTYQ